MPPFLRSLSWPDKLFCSDSHNERGRASGSVGLTVWRPSGLGSNPLDPFLFAPFPLVGISSIVRARFPPEFYCNSFVRGYGEAKALPECPGSAQSPSPPTPSWANGWVTKRELSLAAGGPAYLEYLRHNFSTLERGPPGNSTSHYITPVAEGRYIGKLFS